MAPLSGLCGNHFEEIRDAGEEHDNQQLHQAQDPERCLDGHRADEYQLRDIGRHEQAPVRQAVHPGVGVEAEQEVQQESRGAEESHADGRGRQRQPGRQRQRDVGDAGAEQ
ncbi:hypothetical protein AB0K15_36250 [Amycolatopsis sp. NPDC049253]|uniref:hypothetical protein n=1 Tax=Amycolatopsis sp. NPDC049253 TaxID=3155274 RepID=UPI003436BF8A